MRPLAAALLLGSLSLGSPTLIFKKIDSVEFTSCNETVLIPCLATNVDSQDISELYVVWSFERKPVFFFDGLLNRATVYRNLSSAKISVSELLKGNASLEIDKSDAKDGNYTCELSELSRVGEKTIYLKQRAMSWFSEREKTVIVTLPVLTVFLYWIEFGILTYKYRASLMNGKIIISSIAGLIITTSVIVGAILFVPGEYSKRKAHGLYLLVSLTGVLILLHYYMLTPAFGMTVYVIVILMAVQLLGYILAMVGVSFCLSVCEPTHGSLVISGLAIIALVEFVALIYMKFTTFLTPVMKYEKKNTNSFLGCSGCSVSSVCPRPHITWKMSNASVSESKKEEIE